ncbi:unnamed protein product [Polarella glacialis]|uniref:GDP-fucose protein O-fucosyltransferase 2 n=1 Tax=Polarella glacialis TaxID=89957 RepID=A0A813D9G3_POLGL|nr:unnamed protein product [Polarella glacialis]
MSTNTFNADGTVASAAIAARYRNALDLGNRRPTASSSPPVADSPSRRVKMGSGIYQACDTEVHAMNSSEARTIIETVAVQSDGIAPDSDEECYATQLQALKTKLDMDIGRYAGFAVWRPYGFRMARRNEVQNSGLETRERTIHRLRDGGASEPRRTEDVLEVQLCHERFGCVVAHQANEARKEHRRPVSEYSGLLRGGWWWVSLAYQRLRPEQMERLRRKLEMSIAGDETNNNFPGYDKLKPWDAVLLYASQDRDFWDSEVKRKPALATNVKDMPDPSGEGHHEAGDEGETAKKGQEVKTPLRVEQGKDGKGDAGKNWQNECTPAPKPATKEATVALHERVYTSYAKSEGIEDCHVVVILTTISQPLFPRCPENMEHWLGAMRMAGYRSAETFLTEPETKLTQHGPGKRRRGNKDVARVTVKLLQIGGAAHYGLTKEGEGGLSLQTLKSAGLRSRNFLLGLPKLTAHDKEKLAKLPEVSSVDSRNRMRGGDRRKSPNSGCATRGRREDPGEKVCKEGGGVCDKSGASEAPDYPQGMYDAVAEVIRARVSTLCEEEKAGIPGAAGNYEPKVWRVLKTKPSEGIEESTDTSLERSGIWNGSFVRRQPGPDRPGKVVLRTNDESNEGNELRIEVYGDDPLIAIRGTEREATSSCSHFCCAGPRSVRTWPGTKLDSEISRLVQSENFSVEIPENNRKAADINKTQKFDVNNSEGIDGGNEGLIPIGRVRITADASQWGFGAWLAFDGALTTWLADAWTDEDASRPGAGIGNCEGQNAWVALGILSCFRTWAFTGAKERARRVKESAGHTPLTIKLGATSADTGGNSYSRGMAGTRLNSPVPLCTFHGIDSGVRMRLTEEATGDRPIFPTNADTGGNGYSRVIACTCLDSPVPLCTFHDVGSGVRMRLTGEATGDRPIFPTESGKFPSAADTIETWANVLDGLTDKDTAGHVPRRSGAQSHTRLGVPMWWMANLGRWGSRAVSGYREEASREEEVSHVLSVIIVPRASASSRQLDPIVGQEALDLQSVKFELAEISSKFAVCDELRADRVRDSSAPGKTAVLKLDGLELKVFAEEAEREKLLRVCWPGEDPFVYNLDIGCTRKVSSDCPYLQPEEWRTGGGLAWGEHNSRSLLKLAGEPCTREDCILAKFRGVGSESDLASGHLTKAKSVRCQRPLRIVIANKPVLQAVLSITALLISDYAVPMGIPSFNNMQPEAARQLRLLLAAGQETELSDRGPGDELLSEVERRGTWTETGQARGVPHGLGSFAGLPKLGLGSFAGLPKLSLEQLDLRLPGTLDGPQGVLVAESLAEVRNHAAVGLMDQHRYSEAELELQHAVKLAPQKPLLWYNLGTALIGLRRHKEAQVCLERALALDDSLSSAHFNLARIHMTLANSPGPLDLGDFLDSEARELQLRSALRHLNSSVDAFSSTKSREETFKSMEEAFYMLGDTANAWSAYRRLLELAPHEGLKARSHDGCVEILAWLEDRALELPPLWSGGESPQDGELELAQVLYPQLPAFLPSELCVVFDASVKNRSESANAHQDLHLRFEQQGFAQLTKGDIPWSDDAIAAFAAYFMAVHHAGGYYRDSKEDPRALLSAGRWSLDNDRLANFLAGTLRPVAESAAGKALKLGFAKVALYEAGAELPPHHDQILNEVSVTLVLQSTEGQASGPHWPLVLRRLPKPMQSDLKSNATLLYAPTGEGLVFRGRDFLHSRPCCLPEGQHSLVLLLHYVEAAFPEFQCRTFVNVTAATTEELLQHQCVEVTANMAQRYQYVPSSSNSSNTSSSKSDEDLNLGVYGKQAASSRSHDTNTSRLTSTTTAPKQYLLYNPCATNMDPTYCQSQFNNQVMFFLHALSVAKCLGRTLVLPPFMWMEHQMAEQNWYPFERFFDLGQLKKRFGVIRLEDFLELHKLQHPGGRLLWWYYYPPYLVDREPHAFKGIFFRRYMNLSFAMPKRMSPFWEVRMTASGRGQEPFGKGEGRSYWTAARLLLGQIRAESADFHAAIAAAPSSIAAWMGLTSPLQPLSGGREEASLVNKQSIGLEQWKATTRTLDIGQDLQPAENISRYEVEAGAASSGRYAANVDVLVFDFAPSYNFRFDRFDFDWELRRNRRALRFSSALEDAAERAVAELFGGGSFVALHLRRDGYAEFCHAEELRAAAGGAKLRFGFRSSRAACNPSEDELLRDLLKSGLGLGPGLVPGLFLATNSRDDEEILQLAGTVRAHFGVEMRQLRDAVSSRTLAPETVPIIELLIAARSSAFVGNAMSTFTMNIVMERDVRGLPRNSTIFNGIGRL